MHEIYNSSKLLELLNVVTNNLIGSVATAALLLYSSHRVNFLQQMRDPRSDKN